MTPRSLLLLFIIQLTSTVPAIAQIPPMCGSLGQVTLISPDDFATITTNDVHLSWSWVSGHPDKYEYQVATDFNFSSGSIVATGTTIGTDAYPTLPGINTYYWRARAKCNLGQTGAWAVSRTLYIVPSGGGGGGCDPPPGSPPGTPCDPLQTLAARKLPASDVPMKLELSIANPQRGNAVIRYGVPESGAGSPIEIRMFDLAGRGIATLAKGTARPGRFEEHWDLRSNDAVQVRPGLYFVRLRLGDEVSRGTLVITP